MPRLSKRIVDAIQPGECDKFLWDDGVKGFGLKVTPHGVCTYVLQYRLAGGRGSPTRRFTIGRHGSPWTPDTARGEALRLLGLVKSGHDPMAAKRQARAAAAAPAPELATFGDVLDRFEVAYKRRSARASMQVIRNATWPAGWHHRPVGQITRRDVIALLDTIEARGTIYLRNRLHAHLHTLFNWCVGRDIINSNPVAQIAKLPETTRDRVLDEDELRRVWLACDLVGWPFGAIVRMLMLTGQRRDEVGGMTWAEVGPEALWTIPAARVKNARVHDVPLAAAAVELLAGIPPLGDHVFTLNGITPWNGWGGTKRRLDAASGVTGWRLHDLRRTVATEMAKLGIPQHVVEKLLNHRSGVIKGIAAVYNRHEYRDERQQALEAWARRLDTIVNREAKNVDVNLDPTPRWKERPFSMVGNNARR